MSVIARIITDKTIDFMETTDNKIDGILTHRIFFEFFFVSFS